MEPPNIAASNAAAGWYPDPTRRFEFRYFNGQRWTADVSRQSVRYVDPIGTAPHAFYSPPSRAMAITALVFALCSVLVAWIPFLFVVGAAGAIVALILGILVLRKSARLSNEGQPVAIGQGMAVTSICVAIAALALCVVGFQLTRVVLREVDELVNPGPHEIQIDTCEMRDGHGVVEGSIRNVDTEAHGYTITVAYRLGGDLWETDSVSVSNVAPRTRVDFVVASDSVDFSSAQLTCAIDSVFGPTPFSD